MDGEHTAAAPRAAASTRSRLIRITYAAPWQPHAFSVSSADDRPLAGLRRCFAETSPHIVLGRREIGKGGVVRPVERTEARLVEPASGGGSMRLGKAHQHGDQATIIEDQTAVLIRAGGNAHHLHSQGHAARSSTWPSRWRYVGSNSPAFLRPSQFVTVRRLPFKVMRPFPLSS